VPAVFFSRRDEGQALRNVWLLSHHTVVWEDHPNCSYSVSCSVTQMQPTYIQSMQYDKGVGLFNKCTLESWQTVSLICRCVCLFVCNVYNTDFSVAEQVRGVKFYMQVRLLSAMSLSHFGELWWLAGSHGGGITSGMNARGHWCQRVAAGEAQWGFGIGCRGSVGQSELGAAALLKAVWWDVHLASLLTHLLWYHFRSKILIIRTFS